MFVLFALLWLADLCSLAGLVIWFGLGIDCLITWCLDMLVPFVKFVWVLYCW